MGSGHFLVSLVDTLADHVLDAMAEAAALGIDLHYTSSLADKIEDIRVTILKNAKAANWTIDEEQLDDRHIIRRMVLKRCVYGVDKNPMAVELAKVALWLHTFTVGAPLSFIDHHLHAGDSLFGLWVRDAIDKATAMGGELFYHEALRNAQRSAEAMKTIEALTDVEIAEAHRSAAMYEDVELMTGELDGFVSFMHALDWLDLKAKDKALVRLWLDGRFGDPIPIARGRKTPAGGMAKPEEAEAFTAIWERARSLIVEERFLNWQISFPGVWDNWASKGREGGFDAVVGNPPWDRIKLQQIEWFAARRPEIARAQRASDRGRMIAKLKADHDPLWGDFTHAELRAVDTARMARKSGHYPLLSGGDTNLNSLFVERAHALVKPGGMVGLLIPSGLASDQSSSAFFRKVTGAKQVHCQARTGDDPLGELRADAPDHAGAEIAGHALHRRGRRGLQQVRLELQAVRSIREPDSDSVDVLTGGDRSRMSDEGDQVPPASRLDLEDREAGVRVVERHPLDAADQRFAIRSALAVRVAANGPLSSCRLVSAGPAHSAHCGLMPTGVPDPISTAEHRLPMFGRTQVALQGWGA